MTQDADRSYVDQLGEKPLVRVVAYYVALAAVVVLLSRVWPDLLVRHDRQGLREGGAGAGDRRLESAEVYDSGYARSPGGGGGVPCLDRGDAAGGVDLRADPLEAGVPAVAGADAARPAGGGGGHRGHRAQQPRRWRSAWPAWWRR